MRILLLTHRYSDLEIGGLAEFLHFLPSALKKHHHEAIIYTQSQSATSELQGPFLLSNGAKHYTGPFLKPTFFISSAELLPLMTLCQKEKIDLVHAQGTYRAGFMAMHLQRKLGIPYVVTSHSDILPTNSERIKRPGIQKRCRKILKRAAYVTHLTPVMQAASDDIYPTPHKSNFIHNGIDVGNWKAYQGKTTYNYLLAIGRLEEEKGFPVLLDAFAKLREENPAISLVFAGSGSIQQALIAKAQILNIPIQYTDDLENLLPGHLVLTGYVRHDVKKKLFAHAKLILFATQPHLFEEAFGIVQLEALAAKKMILASATQATCYLKQLGAPIHLVTQPHESAVWAQKIKRLLSDNRTSQSNEEFIQRFDWDIIAKDYANVYSNVLAK